MLPTPDMGKSQYIMEHDWHIAKLLLLRAHPKILSYVLPKYNIYLQSLDPLYKRSRGPGISGAPPAYHLPNIAVVRTLDLDTVVDFIQENPEFQAHKIFKHGDCFGHEDHPNGFRGNVVKNVLALCRGSTLRIKSNDKEQRGKFYKTAREFNLEDKFGCSFDYDRYDYTLEIKRYNKPNGKFVLVTILYGYPDFINHWNMES